MGYDDAMTIKNTTRGKETTGALLIRNSWGTGWGDGGYGWLPYDYILRGMDRNWWTIFGKGGLGGRAIHLAWGRPFVN